TTLDNDPLEVYIHHIFAHPGSTACILSTGPGFPTTHTNLSRKGPFTCGWRRIHRQARRGVASAAFTPDTLRRRPWPRFLWRNWACESLSLAHWRVPCIPDIF